MMWLTNCERRIYTQKYRKEDQNNFAITKRFIVFHLMYLYLEYGVAV